MIELVEWLASTALSNWLAGEMWVVPTVQSAHIVAVAVIFGSLLMLTIRILGWAGADQSIGQLVHRFSPWIWGSLAVLAMTGVVLIVIEPARELLSISFWLKMIMLAIGSAFVVALQLHLKAYRGRQDDFTPGASIKALSAVALLIWIAVMALGRLIAWDGQIWGGTLVATLS